MLGVQPAERRRRGGAMGYPDCCSNQLVWGPNVESDSGFFLMFGVGACAASGNVAVYVIESTPAWIDHYIMSVKYLVLGCLLCDIRFSVFQLLR